VNCILFLVFMLRNNTGRSSDGIKCHKSVVVNEATAVYPKGGSETKENI